MRRKGIADSFDGHASERLIPFLAWIPLIFFGLTPIFIATNMTNPIFTTLRVAGGGPKKTKWMTLKWRVILMTISLVTLVIYNIYFWDAVNLLDYTLLDRMSDSFSDGVDFNKILFYILMPLLSLFYFVKAIVDLVNSKNARKRNSQINTSKELIKAGIQFSSFALFFMLMCSIADGIHSGTFVFEDFIIMCNFYWVSCLPWIFVKYD